MEPTFTKLEACRICGNKNLVSVLHLGDHALTGVFPKDKSQKITSGPLELVKCQEDETGLYCGLVQLGHTYSKEEMYGDNYGYRSGLNQSMVDHLNAKADRIKSLVKLEAGDVVVDIGSNDATFLKNFGSDLTLVGIDPSAMKFKEHYPSHIALHPDFFSAEVFQKNYPGKKAKVVTSIAMFYDLDAPLTFVQHIYDILADDGVWVVEQSYLPTMLATNSYDTVCHEHLEYYRLQDIQWMAEKVGFKIIDIEFNAINGGSFSVTLAKKEAAHVEASEHIKKILEKEKEDLMHTNTPVKSLHDKLVKMKEDLMAFIGKTKTEGKTIMGYGASTKGNVLLQFCNITPEHLPYIAEVNPHKFGSFTPHTLIPIIDEKEVKAMKPDYLLVLPWHFRNNIIEKEQEYLKSGGTLVFPLPELGLVTFQSQK